MSFFGGSTANIPEQPPKVLGYDAQRTSTHEAARPLPYLAGTNVFALTWISDLYDVIVTTTTTEIAKNSTVSESYYTVSFAGIGCHGPLDEISEIRFGGETVWQGSVSRGGDDDVEITIESRGTAHVYWGTETQTPDADLEAGTGLSHPAYRGQFYIVFTISLTPGQTNIENIEVIGSRYPSPSWMTASSNLSGDANLAAVIGEFLQNQRFGLGYADSKIDFVLLDNFANTLDVEDFGVSPYVSRETTIRQFLVEACEYVDGYPVVGRDGKIGFQLIRADDESSGESPESLIELGPDDIIGLPRDESIGWRDTFNRISVTFHDEAIDYSENESVFHDDANFQITGEQKHERLERPWVTRMSVASRIAIGRGKVAGVPRLKGSFTVRLSSLDGRDVGDRFNYSWPQLGISSVTCRITKWRQDSPQRPQVTINYEEDLSHLSTEYFIPDIESPVSPTPLTPQPLSYQDVLSGPYGLLGAGVPGTVLFLASRDQIESKYRIYYKLQSNSTYLPGSNWGGDWIFSTFALRGHLTANYGADTDIVDTVEKISVEIDSFDDEPESMEREDAVMNLYLLFVNNEIMAVFDATMTAEDNYDFSTVRNRYDTSRDAHSINDECFIIRAQNVGWLPISGLSAPLDFKLQPGTNSTLVDLDDVTALSLSSYFRFQRPARPINLTVNGDGSHPVWNTGENIAIGFRTATTRRIDYGLFENTRETFDYLQIEFYDAGGTLVATNTYSTGSNIVIANANMISILGSEQNFTIKVRSVVGALTSFAQTELFVDFA